MANLPSDWAVATVAAGETTSRIRRPRLAPALPATGIRVVVTQKTAAVSGVVLDANGQPKPGARVVIFPADNRQWHARSRFVQTAEVGADGRYTVRGLLPGKYLAAVVERLEDGAWEVSRRAGPAAADGDAADGDGWRDGDR